MSTYFPMFMDISKVVTIVVGGGKIAERRIQTLRQFFAQLRQRRKLSGKWKRLKKD